YDVQIIAINVPIRHVVSAAPLGQIFLGTGPLDLGAHRDHVVLDDKNGRQLPQAGEVQGFVEGALIDGAVAEERDADAASAPVPAGERRPASQRNLAADDAVTSQVSDVGLE